VSIRRKLLAMTAGILAIALCPDHLLARDTSIAVIVNPRNFIEFISLAELRNIFLGTQQFWKDGTPVVPIMRAPSAKERDVLVRHVVHMSDLQFQQYWRKRRTARKAGHEPLAMVSNGMQMQTVSLETGGIALVATSDLHDGIKVLKVGGRRPGAVAYPLKTPAAR
jgi:ABC-type phosphate transport system substrate-binding protein